MNDYEKVGIIGLILAGIGTAGYLLYKRKIVSTTSVLPAVPSAIPAGNYSLDLSNCTCVQGFGGTLSLSECQSQIVTVCQPLHQALIVMN